MYGTAAVSGSAAALQERAQQLVAFQSLSNDLGESASNVALGWLLHQSSVTATIVGPASSEQLDNLLSVPELVLEQETLDALDRIFPPCGAAPEAYAW